MLRTLVLLVGALGCGDWPLGSDDAFPAILEYAGHPAHISTPESVQRNASFDVEFTTYEMGCTQFAGNRVAHFGREVRIWSMQRVLSDVLVDCNPDTRVVTHRVHLTMPFSGIAVIRVHGAREPGTEHLVLQRIITVTDR